METPKQQNTAETQVNQQELSDQHSTMSSTEGASLSGIPSGFDALDKVTCGWQKSELVIIGALSAMGKTAFILSMAKNIAIDKRIPTAIFSLERTCKVLTNFLFANISEIDWDKIRNDNLTDEERNCINSKIKDIQSAPLYIDDTSPITVDELCCKAHTLVHEKEVKLIVIDELALLYAPAEYRNDREQETDYIVKRLKELSVELDIPILLNNKLIHGTATSPRRVPQYSYFYYLDSMKYADRICLFYRPAFYNIFIDPETGEDLHDTAFFYIVTPYQESETTPRVRLHFRRDLCRFDN